MKYLPLGVGGCGLIFFLGGTNEALSEYRVFFVCSPLWEANFTHLVESIFCRMLVTKKGLIEDITRNSLFPKLMIDNQSTIKLIKNPEFHKKTKHIDIKYNFVRDYYRMKFFDVVYVPSEF